MEVEPIEDKTKETMQGGSWYARWRPIYASIRCDSKEDSHVKRGH